MHISLVNGVPGFVSGLHSGIFEFLFELLGYFGSLIEWFPAEFFGFFKFLLGSLRFLCGGLAFSQLKCSYYI